MGGCGHFPTDLDGFHEHGPDGFFANQVADQPHDLGFARTSAFHVRWEWNEPRETSQLIEERLAEEVAMGGVERAIPETVVGAFEGDDPGPPRGQARGLEGRLRRLRILNCRRRCARDRPSNARRSID